MPKFSIIIPVYKSEKYLVTCIESVLAQTFQDFEMILVDDGSPDGCGKICDKYAESDSRIKVIHKVNGGVSSARNVGLDAANGEYIVFIDSDDSISVDYLEGFAELDCDINICGRMNYFPNNTHFLYKEEKFIQSNVTNQYLLELFNTKRMLCVWSKSFKRKLIEEVGNLRFRSDISYGEDTIFTMTLFKMCKSVGFTDKSLYRYFKYESGTLTNTLNEKLVTSCFKEEKFIQLWLEELNIYSYVFLSPEFPTKSKMKWAFYKIFEDLQMETAEKHKWYKLFLHSDVFRKNIDIMFPDISKGLKLVLKLRSPCLLLFYQYLSKKRS